MNYLLDLMILLIAGVTIFVYYKKGFVRAVLGFGKVILAFICASIFGKSLGALIAEKFMDGKITGSVYNTLSGMYEAGSSAFDLSKIAEKIPKSLITLAEKSGANLDTITAGYAADTAASGERLQELASQIALPISAFISKIIGYVLVFIIAFILLAVAAFFIEKIAELPVLRTVNRLLGLCLGIACACIYILLFVFAANIVIYFIVASKDASAALEIVNKTIIFRFISQLNIL